MCLERHQTHPSFPKHISYIGSDSPLNTPWFLGDKWPWKGGKQVWPRKCTKFMSYFEVISGGCNLLRIPIEALTPVPYLKRDFATVTAVHSAPSRESEQLPIPGTINTQSMKSLPPPSPQSLDSITTQYKEKSEAPKWHWALFTQMQKQRVHWDPPRDPGNISKSRILSEKVSTFLSRFGSFMFWSGGFRLGSWICA